MDFEFQNDEEETFIAEKTKSRKDSSAKKKSISTQLFRSDRRDKNVSNDFHSPVSVKQKHIVHGLVGPAEYDHQSSPPLTDTPVLPTTTTQMISGINSSTESVNVLWSNNQSPNILQVQNIGPVSPFPQHTQHASQVFPPVPQVPTSEQYVQPAPISKPNLQNNQGTGTFQPSFPPVTAMSTKIERPHSSAALLQERQDSQAPTPFKQPQTPQKVTLLAQALSTTQFSTSPQQSLQSPMSLHMTHQRNQSYSRAMSAPVLSKPPDLNPAFEAIFGDAEHRFQPSSPIQEVATPLDSGNSMSTPQTPDTEDKHENEIWSDGHNSSLTQLRHIDGSWANFSLSSTLPEHDVQYEESLPKRKNQLTESSTESIPESTSSIEEDGDDDESVWCINDEQKAYYTNQFNNIKPTDADVIKGPQARDFFLKSNLPNEILSKIWHLSDLDNDFALNLDEFCIAMHLVVAVRHGVELPSILPSSLLPNDEADPLDVAGTSEEEFFHDSNEEKLSQIDEWSADFDVADGGRNRLDSGESSTTNDSVQTMAQPSTISYIPMETRVQPVSQPQKPSSPVMQTKIQVSIAASSSENVSNTSDTTIVVQGGSADSPKLRHNSTPSLKETLSGAGTAIARPRASANKNVNLMDAPPWLLLPPPSSKVKITGSVDDNIVDDNIPTLVAIEKSTEEFGVTPFEEDSDVESDKLNVTKQRNHRSAALSKEKSRSIDSLRSDISESNEFSWRRLSRRDSRPRSFTGSSANEPVLPSQVEKTKELPQEIPPTPPPRNRGHARASSLDLNQLFAVKASHAVSDLKLREPDSRLPPQKPPRISVRNKVVKENADQNVTIHSLQQDSKSNSSLHPATNERASSHRRSFSLDSDVLIAPPQNATDELVARTESAEKKGGSELSQTDAGSQINKDYHNVRFADPEITKTPQTPIEKKMRKNELQARLHLLRNDNTALSTLLCQLDIEWKEISQERISLDVQLQKMKQT